MKSRCRWEEWVYCSVSTFGDFVAYVVEAGRYLKSIFGEPLKSHRNIIMQKKNLHLTIVFCYMHLRVSIVRFQLSIAMDDKIYMVVIVTIFGIVAVIGNFVMIHVLFYKKMLKRPMHLILFHLQCVDLLIFLNQIFRCIQVGRKKKFWWTWIYDDFIFQLIFDKNETKFCLMNISIASIIIILTVESFVLVLIGYERYLVFYQREYNGLGLSLTAAWFFGFVLSVIQLAAGFTSKYSDKCPESLNLHESTVFVIIAIILGIFVVLSFVGAVILFSLVGKKMRNFTVKKLYVLHMETGN